MPNPDPGYIAPNPALAMANSPAMYIHDFLVQQSALIGWEVDVGRLPAKPDAAVAILDTSGPAGPSPILAIDYPGVQLMVRGTRISGYPTSQVKARELRDRLLGLASHPAEFPWLDIIVERGTCPLFVGWDDNQCPIWSCNFQLTVEPGVSAFSHRTSL